MYTQAFTMRLKPGHVDEYKKRHDEIWPELSELLLLSGILKYHIFLDEENLTLFAFQELADDNSVKDLPQSPIMIKWWKHMSDIMETMEDNSPFTQGLKEVFALKNSDLP